ncbi:MAG: hypothetical protein ACXVKC_17955, partial [Candidatus Angelobacter sp.]
SIIQALMQITKIPFLSALWEHLAEAGPLQNGANSFSAVKNTQCHTRRQKSRSFDFAALRSG